MKKKICFIQTYAYPLFKKNNSIHGGSEIQLYLIAKKIADDKDYSVSFIVGDYGNKNIEKINNISIYKSFNPKENDNIIKKLFHAYKYYKLFKKINADIYFTSSANSNVGLVSYYCKRNKKKHIHRTAHQMDVDGSYIDKKGLIGRIYKYGLIHSDLIITQNEEHKILLKQNHDIESVVVKNGFDFNSVLKNNSIKNRIHILWVARYEKWKRPQAFLELAECFPDYNFIMICPAGQEDDNYKDFIEQTKKIDNLKFIKKVNYYDIQGYFDKAVIFVNTSTYEGFPNTFIHAGIAGTPILSLNVNPDNFINKYNCGYFCNDDFKQLKDNLAKLLKNKKDWKEKSNNIFIYTKENHDIKKNINIIKDGILNLNII